MKTVLGLKQGTQEWLKWRNQGLGASDAGIIMGISPYKSPYMFWLERRGILPPEPFMPYQVKAMERGHTLEPVARAWYERQTGLQMTPISAEHQEYPFIRASLDGYNQEHNVGIEIKCPGKEAHSKTLKTGKVPDIYMAQIQQQFMVSGLSRIDFISYSGSDEGQNIIIQVFPDDAYQQILIEKLKAFWNNLKLKTPPEHTQKDISYLHKRKANISALLKGIENAINLTKETNNGE